MKAFLIGLGLLLGLQNASATEVLENCFSNKRAEFFATKLEELAQEKLTPVLLLNAKNEVVGVISTQPTRASEYPFQVKSAEVQSLSLCSSALEVDEFYYAEDDSHNLLNWIKAGGDSIQISQDEGLIVLNAQVVKHESYATLVKVSFKAYDVFNDEEAAVDTTNPDYIEDWGLPKGKGEFYLYLPSNWLKK